MKSFKSKLFLFIILMLPVLASCQGSGDGQDTSDGDAHGHTHSQGTEDHSSQAMVSSDEKMASDGAGRVFDIYLELKNALVADDKDKAAEAGGRLMSALKGFDHNTYGSEKQQEIREIIEDAAEHAEHISRSPIDHQREHFDMLSKDMIDLVEITGTEKTLYVDHCPMYNDNKGANWLSESKEIRNPYYGSRMMSCGSMQRQVGE